MFDEDDMGNTIEPVEEFLDKNICRDKMMLYISFFDLLKETENYSILDGINSIVMVGDDQSAGEVINEINLSIIRHLTELIAAFEIYVNTDNIPLLLQIFKSLTLLDSYDDHNYIVNICQDSSMTPTEKMFELFNIIEPLDEVEYYNIIHIVPMTLIERLKEVHNDYLAVQLSTEEMEFPYPKNLEIVRSICKRYPGLITSRLIDDRQIAPNTPVDAITNRIASYFREYTDKDVSTLALELLNAYLLTPTDPKELIAVVKAQAGIILLDLNAKTAFIAQINHIYNEVMSNVKA